MARPKKPSRELRSLNECGEALREMLIAQTEVEEFTARRDRFIARIQKRYEGRIDGAKKTAAALEASLKAYYYDHVAEIEKDGRKSVQLPEGVFGRRDTPEVVKPLNRDWTWAKITAAVRAKWPGKYLLPAKDPDLDREALRRVAKDDLRQVGLKLEDDEVFYAEPDRPKAKGAAA